MTRINRLMLYIVAQSLKTYRSVSSRASWLSMSSLWNFMLSSWKRND